MTESADALLLSRLDGEIPSYDDFLDARRQRMRNKIRAGSRCCDDRGSQAVRGLQGVGHRLGTFSSRAWRTERAKFVYQMASVRPYDEVVTCFRDGMVTLEEIVGFAVLKRRSVGYQGIRPGDLVIHGMDAFAGAIGYPTTMKALLYNVCQPRYGVNAATTHTPFEKCRGLSGSPWRKVFANDQRTSVTRCSGIGICTVMSRRPSSGFWTGPTGALSGRFGRSGRWSRCSASRSGPSSPRRYPASIHRSPNPPAFHGSALSQHGAANDRLIAEQLDTSRAKRCMARRDLSYQ